MRRTGAACDIRASAMEDLARATAAVNRALRERDENTSAHSGRTCALALEIGEACGLSADDLATLKLAAELHDVGKIGIPDRVLLKPGRLDDEEMRVMRTHPRRGHDILASIGGERHREGRHGRPASPRSRRRIGLPGRPEGRGDSAPVEDRLGRRLLRCDRHRAAVSPAEASRRDHADPLRRAGIASTTRHVLATFATIIERSAYKASAEEASVESLPSTGTAS